MKKLYITILCLLAMSSLFAQSPNAFKYQAAARDASDNLLADTTFEVRMSIITDSASGSIEYQETQTVNTNQFGLFSLEIGNGIPTVNGSVTDFSKINWSNGKKWTQTEIRFGLGNFQTIGQSKLLSVPYAAYAGWNQESDKIYHRGSRVGINNTDPLTRLHIGDSRALLMGNIGGTGSAVFGEYIGFNAQLTGSGVNEFTKLAGGAPTGNGQRGGAAIMCDSRGNLLFQTFDAGAGNEFIAASTSIAPQFELRNNGDACKPGGGSWKATSDFRLKSDIENFDHGLSHVLQIRPVRFHYNGKLGLPTEKEYIGVIAQELQEVSPHMVTEFEGTDGENYLEVDPSDITYMLINAVKELNQKIEALEAEIKVLRKP